jgi:hypothetical protein
MYNRSRHIFSPVPELDDRPPLPKRRWALSAVYPPATSLGSQELI